MPHAVILFKSVVFHAATIYEDDTLHRHPMASKGLAPFSSYEVLNSRKIEHLASADKSSRLDQIPFPSELRHFIFAIHGHVIEVICRNFQLHTETGAVFETIDKLINA